MDSDIEALIQNGGEVSFKRSEDNGNVVCTHTGKDAEPCSHEGRTVHEALVSVLTEARKKTNEAANPHLQP